MAEWIDAAVDGELADGRVKLLTVGERRLALCNVGGEYFCIDDLCTHDGGPLDQGELIDGEIECPRHGARFDVRTGRPMCLPAIKPVATHEVRSHGGDIQIRVSS
jgi:3-phenylpropionate/trans-cinnamate dioxygenase ferredoxin subunit